MNKRAAVILTAITACGMAATALADDLTMTVEQSLAQLGYDTGAVDGEETMETVIAISKFQAENKLDVTGEVTAQLAGTLAAKLSGTAPAGNTVASTATPQDDAALRAAQQACLQEKVAAAKSAQKKKRGFGRLLGAVARVAGRTGNYDLSRTVNDVYDTNATASDLSAAAKDLGLTEDEVASCRNPG